MKPAPFDYVRPDTLDEALEQLADHGEDARVLAGGQSLMPILNMRLARPEVLVDITALAALRGMAEQGAMLTIGAAVTQAQLQQYPRLAGAVPLVARALPWVGHFQTRNRGTVCGSLAHADPSAELPLCLATLGGEVVLQSAQGKRVLAAQDFFQGLLLTARRPEELLIAARFPVAGPCQRCGFAEIALRHGDFAIVAVAVTRGDDGLRIGVGGVADRPWVETLPRLNGSDLEDALNDLAWRLGAEDDPHASAAYRREMVRRLGLELIREVTS